jgi:hypothetical protein
MAASRESGNEVEILELVIQVSAVSAPRTTGLLMRTWDPTLRLVHEGGSRSTRRAICPRRDGDGRAISRASKIKA